MAMPTWPLPQLFPGRELQFNPAVGRGDRLAKGRRQTGQRWEKQSGAHRIHTSCHCRPQFKSDHQGFHRIRHLKVRAQPGGGVEL